MLEEQLKAKMPIRNNKITTSNSGGIEKACWGHWKGPFWFVFWRTSDAKKDIKKGRSAN